MNFDIDKIAQELKPDMFRLLQERGFFKKKKRNLSSEDIDRILKSSLKNYENNYDEYVSDSLKQLINVLREKDPESVSQYIIDRIGDDDTDSFIKHLTAQSTESNSTKKDEPQQSSGKEETPQRKSFPNVLNDYYLDTDRFKNSSVLIQSLVGDDELTLSKYGRMYKYEDKTLKKKELSRDDVSAMITLQLAQILGLFEFLKNDERFKEAYPDLEKKLDSKDNSLMKRFGKWYPTANEMAINFYSKNKEVTDHNPYDNYVEKIQRKIREVKHGQENVEDDETFTMSDQEREELNQKHIEFYNKMTQGENEAGNEDQPKKKKYVEDGNNKEQETEFANNNRKRREALFDDNTLKIANGFINNPEKIETIDVTEFRDLKTIFARKDLLKAFLPAQFRTEKSLSSYQRKVLSMTRSEFKNVLFGMKNNEKIYKIFEKAFLEMIHGKEEKPKEKSKEEPKAHKTSSDETKTKEVNSNNEKYINDLSSGLEDEDEDIANALKDYMKKESINIDIDWKKLL